MNDPDHDGLIRALSLGPPALRLDDWPAVRAALDKPLWVELDYSDSVSQNWLHALDWLPAALADNLHAEDTRPRLINTVSGALLTLRGVNTSPGADPEDMVSVRLWLDARHVIACRKRPVASLADVAEAALEAEADTRPAALVCHLCECLLARAQHVAWEIEEQLDELEEGLLDSNSGEQQAISQLAALRRQMIQLRRYLAPQREVLGQLAGQRLPGFDDADRTRLGNIADHANRLIELLDTLRERALVTLEEHNTRLAAQHERRLYLLSMITAIFLPLSFVTGLLGINVGGMPGVDSSAAFWLVCAGITASGGLIAWYLKRSRWF
jgi:zinc transporter